jgi:hypothetical protein
MHYDWAWADSYLKGGRKKHERPLYDRGLRIWKNNKWDADSDIHVGLPWMKASPYITYHKDGTTTISAPTFPHGWSALRGYSTRFSIQRYGGITVLQRNYKFYLQEFEPQLSPPKIQGCRTCAQSGLVDGWCFARHCYNGSKGEDGRMQCEEHPDAQYIGINHQYRWHSVPCPHGLADGHEVKKGIVCGTCQGAKKYDYGSKPERLQWDGTPLKLRDGVIIKSAASKLERMIADNVEFVIG